MAEEDASPRPHRLAVRTPVLLLHPTTTPSCLITILRDALHLGAAFPLPPPPPPSLLSPLKWGGTPSSPRRPFFAVQQHVQHIPLSWYLCCPIAPLSPPLSCHALRCVARSIITDHIISLISIMFLILIIRIILIISILLQVRINLGIANLGAGTMPSELLSGRFH